MQQDSDDWRLLHPLSPLLRGGRFVAIALVVLVQQLSVAREEPIVALGIMFLVALVALVYGVIAFRFAGYRIIGDHLEAKAGILFRSHRRVPFARIESVDIARPLVPRLFGLVEVRIELASNSDSQVLLRYLGEDEGARVQHELAIARAAYGVSTVGHDGIVRNEPDVTSSAGAFTAPSPQATHGADIASVSPAELLLGYGAAQIFVPLVFFGWLAVGVAFFDVSAGVSLGVGGFLAAGAMLFAALRNLDRMYGFTLKEAGDTLMVQRGLLNQLTQRVPLSRVQGVRIEEPFLWRPFGRMKLIVDVAGYRGNSSEARAETAVLLPIGTRAEVDVVLRRVLGSDAIGDADFVQAPERARWRAPVQSRSFAISWRNTYAIVRSGVLRRQTDVIPHRKVQSLRKVQGPWQRRLRLATLHIDTAGVSVRAVALHRDVEEVDRMIWYSRMQDDRSRT